MELRIPPKRYLLYKNERICLDLFGDTPSILVGSNVMIDYFFIYDRENNRVGIVSMNCDALVTQTDNIDSIPCFVPFV